MPKQRQFLPPSDVVKAAEQREVPTFELISIQMLEYAGHWTLRLKRWAERG